MKNFISICLLVALASAGYSQNDYTFHLDKPFYVSGDIVWYSVKLPSSYTNRQVAFNNYVTDSQGNVQKQYFISNGSKNMIKGHFQIPYSWNSDNYLLALGAQNRSDGVESILAHIEVPIYNDINGGQMEFSQEAIDGIAIEEQIKVSLDKKVYQPREEVSINLDGESLSNVSIVVVDNKFYTDNQIGGQVKTVQSTIDQSVINWNPNPYITGQVFSESGDELRINVLGAYDMKCHDMLYSKADAAGRFKLDLDPFKGVKRFHFNPYLFDEYEDIKVKKVVNIGITAESPITIDSTVLNYIAISQMRKKIYQQYGKVENELIAEETRMNKKDLKPNRVYKISDYQNFDNVAAFFNEILSSELSFVLQEDGTYKGRMYNPKNRKNSNRKESSYFEKEPIFIIDDKITKDANKIARLPLDNIETVGLYYKKDDIKRDFGTFGGSAYAIITTSYPNFLLEENEESDIVELNGFLPTTEVPNITEETILSSEPLYRSMIYWNPDPDSINGRVSVKYHNSDDVSEYIVLVSALDDNGKVLKGYSKYKVRYSN